MRENKGRVRERKREKEMLMVKQSGKYERGRLFILPRFLVNFATYTFV